MRHVYSVDNAELGDCFHSLDFRDVQSQIPFDSHLERHFAGGATHASAVETDANGAGDGQFDQFEIAAVGLDGRADQVDHAPDAFEEFSVPENGGIGVGHGG